MSHDETYAARAKPVPRVRHDGRRRSADEIRRPAENRGEATDRALPRENAFYLVGATRPCMGLSQWMLRSIVDLSSRLHTRRRIGWRVRWGTRASLGDRWRAARARFPLTPQTEIYKARRNFGGEGVVGDCAILAGRVFDLKSRVLPITKRARRAVFGGVTRR